jgi:pimeloyl-ACP methyl ester carboxylesterase
MVLDSGTYRIPEASRSKYKPYDSLKDSLKQYYMDANEIYGPTYGRVMADAFYSFRLPECDINIPTEWLTKISSPTLILHGDRDFFFPAEIPVEMKRAIPNSELALFPNTDHIVMEFYPERAAEMAVEFLLK